MTFQKTEDNLHLTLRPKTFKDFVGQKQSLDNLNVFIRAALTRKEALDHVLLHGPPGLGKTTLAHLIAYEFGASIKMTSAPVLTKAGDLAGILTGLSPHDILFIDEIHRLPATVEEILYSAMEDHRLDIVVGEGTHAKTLQIPLPPFTLVGATTRCGLLSNPLRDRFGILLPLSFYDTQELVQILRAGSQKLDMTIEPEAVSIIAERSRGTPRVGLRLLRRIRDFAQVQSVTPVTKNLVEIALSEMGIASGGLNILDQRYLRALTHTFPDRAVGLETLSATLGETKDTIEDVIEPYLLQQGFIQKTPKGRILGPMGRTCALTISPSFPSQAS